MSSSAIYCVAEIPEGKTAKDVLSIDYNIDEDEAFEMLGGVADYVTEPEEYEGQTEEYMTWLKDSMPEGVFQRDDEENCELVFTREFITETLQEQLDSIKGAAARLTLEDLTDLIGFYSFSTLVNYRYGFWFEIFNEDGNCCDMNTESEFFRWAGAFFKTHPFANELRFAVISAMKYHM